MTGGSKEIIAEILLSFATYGKVNMAQRSPRWPKVIQAYREFCIACGMEPEPVAYGTPGVKVAFSTFLDNIERP